MTAQPRLIIDVKGDLAATPTNPTVDERTALAAAEAWSYACRCDVDARWKRSQERVDSFAGNLGPTVVEPEVYDAVCALQALGIPTFASCGGHAEDFHSPYIGIGFLSGAGNGSCMERPLSKWLDAIYRQLGYGHDLNADVLRLQQRGPQRSLKMIQPTRVRRRREYVVLDEDYRLLIARAQKQMRQLGIDLKTWFFVYGATTCPCHSDTVWWPRRVRELYGRT